MVTEKDEISDKQLIIRLAKKFGKYLLIVFGVFIVGDIIDYFTGWDTEHIVWYLLGAFNVWYWNLLK